jgi:hypothetical protein
MRNDRDSHCHFNNFTLITRYTNAGLEARTLGIPSYIEVVYQYFPLAIVLFT